MDVVVCCFAFSSRASRKMAANFWVSLPVNLPRNSHSTEKPTPWNIPIMTRDNCPHVNWKVASSKKQK